MAFSYHLSGTLRMISCSSLGDVALLGRLGNQLFQYAFLRSAARRLGTRFYCPPWMGDRIFHLDDERERAPEPQAPSRTYRQPRENCGFDAEALRVEDGSDVFGFFQSERYFCGRSEVRRWYRFREEVASVARRKYGRVDFSDAVGLHLRFGDKKGLPLYYLPSPGYYRRAVSRHARHRRAVLVFSDEPPLAREHLRGLGGGLVFMEGNAPAEDLYLMTLCRDFVCSPSTLSWWGAWLDPREGKTVVVPAEGHLRPGAPIRNPGYWCDGWLRLRSLTPLWDGYRAACLRARAMDLLRRRG